MKMCSKCKQEKDKSKFNKNRSSSDGLQNWCKGCIGVYIETHQREKSIYNKKYRERNPNYDKIWRKNHPGYSNKIVINWIQNNPGKWKNYRATVNATRKRNLEWKLLYPNPFANCEEVDGHHIDDIHVVYLPRDLHQLYGGMSTEQHRESLSYIVDQIYG